MNTRLHHDGSVDISVGKSRKETSWKQQRMLWSELAAKLCHAHRTAELYNDYVKAKKDRQDEIKDVGGFVGGVIVGGRRKAGSVLSRRLLTLDLDYASTTFWEDFTMLYGCAAVMYTTHKHSPTAPRMRLVIPLDRDVAPDEYEAISRKVAGNLGIELFDPTTFQPERLMYWPSAAKDGEFLSEVQDGTWLSANSVLSEYVRWQDASQWPVSARVSELVLRGMTKQGDPLEKPGTIGAFCRVYSMTEALEVFLADVYAPCDVEGRYSFIGGSTSGGLVVYEDKFAYSHHGTDPTSGKLCNAFDLVRLHLFGLKDEDAGANVPNNKKPSYLAMLDLAHKDSRVKMQILAESTEEARREFGSLVIGEDGVIGNSEDVDPDFDDNWMDKLDVDRKGNVAGTIDNIVIILENDPHFRGRIAFDDFEKCEVAVKDLPWRGVTWNSRRITDKDDANIRHYLEKVYGVSSSNKVQDAMLVWAQKTMFHPIKDYLNSLVWDGEERLETMLIDYLGAEDCEYTRAVTRKTFVAAVARVFRPGIKFDTILTPVGPQGSKKSSLVDRMGGKWYSDSFSFHTLSRNESKALEQIQGVWLVEVPEMSGMAKAEVESVKHFVSKREDRFRVAYGRKTENFPRQCVFIGNSNNLDFLKDPTGNRRFWPVPIGVQEKKYDVLKDLTEDVRSQLWAEAVHLFEQGEKLYLEGSVLEQAVAVQLAHTERHPWMDVIQEYLDTLIPQQHIWNEWDKYQRYSWYNVPGEKAASGYPEDSLTHRCRVCVQEIWYEALGQRNNMLDERSAKSIRKCMSMIEGWDEEKEARRFGAYGLQRKGYFRIESPVLNLSKITE